MKFAYKFNNILGTVYKKGNLLFTPDGNSVISPVGNRITIFDLKNNKTTTLPVESRFNYNAIDISPNGTILIAINEEGDAQIISLISQTVIHNYRFKRKVRAVRFSPDGEHFAVCKENNVFVFKSPGPITGTYTSFIMEKVFHAAFDATTCLDWSFDSKVLAVGAKDMSIKLYPIKKCANFKICSLSGHTERICGVFFEKASYDINTICTNGQLCVWECNYNPNEVVEVQVAPPKRKKQADDEGEDDIEANRIIERTQEEITASLDAIKLDAEGTKDLLYYKRLARHYLADDARKNNRDAHLTAVMYHKATKILVTGFSTGAFYIHDLPDVNLIHSLSISEMAISSICINNTGDWITLGCGGLGQLLVWEWQSETYVMKQQGHSNNMSCVAYSVDGQLLATGGEDGKLKLWNLQSGYCFVTFSEHSGPITAISFSGTKKFVVSSSLDGTVRAFDIIRYRNFKTFTSPRPVQFSCVGVDYSGEFVAAGGQDVFEVFLWSIKTGRLLEILAGHEGPIASLAFSPISTSSILATTSWDKTLRIWDAIEKGSAHESIDLMADGLAVAFRPDGQQVAVATLNGHILFFDVRTGEQCGSIEGRNDLGSGRSDTDLITAKKSQEAKAFTSLCYSADGECIIGGGQSKFVCIYNVAEGIILKKFEITQNRSLDAVDDFINRRKMTSFGNVALVEEREETEGGKVALRLPGARKGDMASRAFKPEIRVFSIQFSPTGQQWAAATTEGLMVYSLASGLIFDPWDLQIGITPGAVKLALEKEEFVDALTMAMKLNEANLIQEVMENVPIKSVELIITSLGEQYIQRLLVIIASALESSNHFEFYLIWAQTVLSTHGQIIKGVKSVPSLLALEKSIVRKYEQLAKMCDYNKYTMQFVMSLGDKMAKKTQLDKMELDSDDEDEIDAKSEYESDEAELLL